MKLLVDARAMGKRPSGIGMYIFNMVSELKKHSQLELVLITDVVESNEMNMLIEQGIRVCTYGREVRKNLGLIRYYKFVQKIIISEKPDMFWEGNSLVPIQVKNPYGKMMVTIHDMFPITEEKHYGRKYKYYFWYGVKKTIRNFDLLIYNSAETKQETERIFPKARKKQSFIGYIIVNKLPDLDIKDNQSFLYVGNLETRKGTDLLLNAYKQYKEFGGTKKLRFAGKMREPEIEKLYEKISREIKGLEYLGYIDNEERNKEYAECSAFVFPSRAEGFGMPLIEVMSYNKPILVVDLNIYHEIIGNSIQYAKLEGNYDQQVKVLAKSMLEMDDKVNIEAYHGVLNKYSGKTIVGNLLKAIEECVGNEYH